MDGLVPAAPAGAMQSATIGALLGSLSAEEKLGVLAGLFQFIQPSQATSPSANRALKIAEALMADKPSSELAGLVGVAGSSRLQQMTPPVEVKKETRDFGVQVEPPPAILPPPRVFEDRAASTAAPSRRTDADSQTDARRLVERAASPIPQASVASASRRAHTDGPHGLPRLPDIIDVDDDQQLAELSRQLSAGRLLSAAPELIVEDELKAMGRLFDAMMHGTPLDEAPSNARAATPSSRVKTDASVANALDKVAPEQAMEAMQVDSPLQLHPAPQGPSLAPAPSEPPVVAAKKRKRAAPVQAAPVTAPAPGHAPKRSRPDGANPLKRKRTSAPVDGDQSTVLLEVPVEEAAATEAQPKPKRRRRAASTSTPAESAARRDSEYVPVHQSIRLIAKELASQDVPQSASSIPPPPPPLEAEPQPAPTQPEKQKKGWPKGKPRKPDPPPDPPTSAFAHPVALGTQPKRTYAGRGRKKSALEEAEPAVEEHSPITDRLSQEDQDAAASLATLSSGGRQNGNGNGSGHVHLDTSALDQLALVAQQEDERRSRSPKSPQQLAAQASQQPSVPAPLPQAVQTLQQHPAPSQQPDAQIVQQQVAQILPQLWSTVQHQSTPASQPPASSSVPPAEPSQPCPTASMMDTQQPTADTLAPALPTPREVEMASHFTPPGATSTHLLSPAVPREDENRDMSRERDVRPPNSPKEPHVEASWRPAQSAIRSEVDAHTHERSTPEHPSVHMPILAVPAPSSAAQLLSNIPPPAISLDHQPSDARASERRTHTPPAHPAEQSQASLFSCPSTPTSTQHNVRTSSSPARTGDQQTTDPSSLHEEPMAVDTLPSAPVLLASVPASSSVPKHSSTNRQTQSPAPASLPETTFAPALPQHVEELSLPQPPVLLVPTPTPQRFSTALSQTPQEPHSSPLLGPSTGHRAQGAVVAASQPPKLTVGPTAAMEEASLSPATPATQELPPTHGSPAGTQPGAVSTSQDEATSMNVDAGIRSTEGLPSTLGRGRVQRGRGGPGRDRVRGRGGATTPSAGTTVKRGTGRSRPRGKALPIPISPYARQSLGDDTDEDEDVPGAAGPSSAAAGRTPRQPNATRPRPAPKRSSSQPAASSEGPLSPSSQLDILDDQIRTARQQPRAGTPFEQRDGPQPKTNANAKPIPAQRPTQEQDRSVLRFRLPALPRSLPGAPYRLSANPVPDIAQRPPPPAPVPVIPRQKTAPVAPPPTESAGSSNAANSKEQNLATTFRDAVTNLRRSDSGSQSASGSRENSVARNVGPSLGLGARRRVSFVVPEWYQEEKEG